MNKYASAILHEPFDFIRVADNLLRKDFASVLRNQKVVLDSDADFPFIDVQPRFVADDHSGKQLIVLQRVDIVHVDSKMMGYAVHGGISGTGGF